LYFVVVEYICISASSYGQEQEMAVMLRRGTFASAGIVAEAEGLSETSHEGTKTL
jgi:hypothetical protein